MKIRIKNNDKEVSVELKDGLNSTYVEKIVSMTVNQMNDMNDNPRTMHKFPPNGSTEGGPKQLND